MIEFWSLESEGAGRSRKYARVILDEAALVPDLKERWEQDIRPTLSDLRGDAFFFSSPRGHDYFWELWNRGFDPAQRGRWLSSQVPTVCNPYIEVAEIEEARDLLPERVYNQEYEAKFLEDNAVFRGIQAAATAKMQVERREGHRYVVGADWGKHEDFTVFTVIDATLNEHVYTERMKQINYMAQIPRLMTINDRFKPVEIVVENNLNDALMEQLHTYNMPITEFRTTSGSKQGIIEDLQMAIERRDLLLLNDPVLIGELQSFGVERTRTGRLRYAARAGYHDDCVMSLAMAWMAARESGEVTSITVSTPLGQRLAEMEDVREYA